MKLQISLLVLLILFIYLHKIREHFIITVLRSSLRPLFSKSQHFSRNNQPPGADTLFGKIL